MPDFTGFDPRSLLTTAVTGKLDTHRKPIPLDQGDEFLATCVEQDCRLITAGPDAKRPGEQYIVMDTTWEIQDPRVKEVTKLESPRARHSCFLDVDPVQGLKLGEQVNIALGAMLDACGIKAKNWTLEQILGSSAIVKIKHRPDEDDPEQVYNEVVRLSSPTKRARAA